MVYVALMAVYAAVHVQFVTFRMSGYHIADLNHFNLFLFNVYLVN